MQRRLLILFSCARSSLRAFFLPRPQANRWTTPFECSAIAPSGPAAQLGQTVRFDDDDLQGSGAALITDLLWELPSAAPPQAGALGSLTQLRLRGGEANHVLVRIDGFEANDPASGSEFDFAQLRSTTVSGMNLLSGAAGALWGSDALAGVLDFKPWPARKTARSCPWRAASGAGKLWPCAGPGARRSRALPSPSITWKPRARTRPAPGRRKMAGALQTLQKGHRALTDR